MSKTEQQKTGTKIRRWKTQQQFENHQSKHCVIRQAKKDNWSKVNVAKSEDCTDN